MPIASQHESRVPRGSHCADDPSITQCIPTWDAIWRFHWWARQWRRDVPPEPPCSLDALRRFDPDAWLTLIDTYHPVLTEPLAGLLPALPVDDYVAEIFCDLAHQIGG